MFNKRCICWLKMNFDAIKMHGIMINIKKSMYLGHMNVTMLPMHI
jgi:hypothetical protein